MDSNPGTAKATTPVRATPIVTSDRHRFVDVLRGFALLGILMVNIEYIVQHADIGFSNYGSKLDLVGRWFIVTFGQMKFFLLFSLLFGYGLALQLNRPSSEDGKFWRRYSRRMLGLVILGVAHATLFFPGDILVIYGLAGGVAFWLRKLSSKTLLILGAVTYLGASGVLLLLGVLDLFTSGVAATGVGSLHVFTEGSFVEIVGQHLVDWPWTFLILLLIQGPPVFALFLVGVVIGRTDLFSNSHAHRGLAKKVLLIAAPIGFIGAGIGAVLSIDGGAADVLGFAIGFAIAPLVTVSYIAAFALLVGAKPSRLLRPFEFGGRMSLTVYLLESVIASSLAYGYGAGLFGTVGPLESLALTASIWLGLSLLAMAWLRFARFGPFEWALRSFTYASPQALGR